MEQGTGSYSVWVRSDKLTQLTVVRKWRRWLRVYAVLSDGNTYVRVSRRSWIPGKALWRREKQPNE